MVSRLRKKGVSETAFDAVVIGSGLGGLTAAALLAKSGRKVCVIERNHSVGGAASAFKTGALAIEPALHQTTDRHDPGQPKHSILKELGLLDQIEWIPISPFFSVKGGPVGDIFDLPVGFDAAHLALSSRFPKSRDSFARLLGAMGDSGLGDGPVLVSVVGVDRFDTGRLSRRRTKRTGAGDGSTPSRRRSTGSIRASARRSQNACSSTRARCTTS